MLHVRPATPDVAEEVDEIKVTISEQAEPLYARDPETGVLLKTSDSVTVRRAIEKRTGKRVRTGSRVQGDLSCRDCGAAIVAGPDDRPFRYLVCGRLNVRAPEDMGQPEEGRWLPHRTPGKPPVWKVVPSEEPLPGGVLECGRWAL